MYQNDQMPPWMRMPSWQQPSSYETDFGPQMGGNTPAMPMQIPQLSGNTPPQPWGMQTGGNTPPMQLPQMQTGGNTPPMFQPQAFGQANAGRARAQGPQMGGLGRWFQGGRRSAY